MLTSLFVSIWLVRYLGPEKYGFFSYSQSYVGLFTVFASLGLDSVVVRDLLKEKNANYEIMGTAFWLKLIGSFGALVVLFLTTKFIFKAQRDSTLIYIIAFSSIFQSFNVIDFYFQSKVKSKFVVYANIITLVISSVTKVVLILINATIFAFAWALFFDSIVFAFLLIYYYLKEGTTFRINNLIFNKYRAILLLKDSWPLVLSGFVITIYMKIDQVIIKDILGNEAVGQYSVAVRISELWHFIPMVIGSSFLPAIINVKKQNEQLYYARLQKLYILMIWIALGIAIPVSLCSNMLVELLYGKAYSQAASVLNIHIWSGVFVFIGVASSNWLFSENLQKYSLINTTIGAIINVALNYILIPKLGIIGAAWATLIAYFIAAYLSLFLWKKTRINFINISKALFLIKINHVNKNR